MAQYCSTIQRHTRQQLRTGALSAHPVCARRSLTRGRTPLLTCCTSPSLSISYPSQRLTPASVASVPASSCPSTSARPFATRCSAAGDSVSLGAAEPGDEPIPQRHSGRGMAASQSRSTALLAIINDLTKWAVSAAVFAVLLARRDLAVAWCVLGSIIASFLNKALKYIINEQRPPSARKADPGMPSSHANSLAFLGLYTALVLGHGAAPLTSTTGPVAAAAVLALSCFLTWLRVRLGYHTTPQVVVGYGLGAATAAAWHQLGTRHALEALAAAPEQRMALYGCTAVAVLLFAVRNVLAWFKERGDGAGPGKAAAKAA
ncbi:hypothetical protein PLESTB_000173900 [Pleodorina starrii]|uniref:Phosphatidic acid phosphatase type 2/haloperoxidase domain-containing protein n=1 Tax=Pleodorina starrii TaxID=330485 RepID=A0A9W6BBG2_9CHLO|nr:hypothetical protein PLESTM_000522900 [Pleodorina starrii]GLC49022.1 hypothetical protein PLESTB_000173900 [Pleodorina starrii]GLC66183.1 hypothetical protein PLESTF_000394000 [Pleodorina starrii]